MQDRGFIKVMLKEKVVLASRSNPKGIHETHDKLIRTQIFADTRR